MITTREQWLEERLKGIGASEAAAVLGLSPYMSNEELWEIKTRRKVAADISTKLFVKYGTEAEAHLRSLFALDFPRYSVGYSQFEMIRNNDDTPFAFATLDGYLVEKDTGRRGVLEIKTTEIMRPYQWSQWDNQVPDHYYIQILHQLMATLYDFAVLKAQIKVKKGKEISLYTRHYQFERDEVQEDIDYLEKQETKFWECVTSDRRPELILPEI